MRKVKRATHSGSFKNGHDPRRQVTKGNKFAAGPRASTIGRPVTAFITQQLIATLNEEFYEDTEKGGRKKTGMTKLAKMVSELVLRACRGDAEATRFIWERIEGRAVQPIIGQVHHTSSEEFAQKLSDKQLSVLTEIAKAAQREREAKVIEHV